MVPNENRPRRESVSLRAAEFVGLLCRSWYVVVQGT